MSRGNMSTSLFHVIQTCSTWTGWKATPEQKRGGCQNQYCSVQRSWESLVFGFCNVARNPIFWHIEYLSALGKWTKPHRKAYRSPGLQSGYNWKIFYTLTPSSSNKNLRCVLTRKCFIFLRKMTTWYFGFIIMKDYLNKF